MLTRLEIRSFALIDHAVFCPGEGLNVISGETGAGKSLLIDAIGLIFGDKASKNLIRVDSDSAYVEAVFEPEPAVEERLAPIMEEYGIPLEDGSVIISRRFSDSGKSIARVNGTSVVLSQLKRISGELIDIHGQSDNSKLFDTAVHIDLLDNYGGAKIASLLNSYRDVLQEYKALTVRYAEVSKLAASSSSRIDYLSFAVNEIDNAGLKPGEDAELSLRKKELSSLARNQAMISDAREYVLGSDSSGLTPAGRLGEALRRVRKLAEKDPSYEEYADRLESLSLELDALSSDFDKKTGESSSCEEEERKVNDRLGHIYELQSKYGKTLEDVLAFAEAARKELDDIASSKIEAANIKKQVRDTENKLLKLATELSEERKKCADELSSEITSELNDLNMPSSSFYVKFSTRPKERFFNANGIDDVAFMFSANPGQPPMDMASIASGGEASRIMLAVKNILSTADMMPTLIFDEIDTGVSGRASLSIARKLKSIARVHQVLCVTHTAQLAAASDHNFLIEKSTDGTSTYTDITPLDEDKKVIEVARLLSGKDDKESRDLASKMIEELRA
ncbi:MAG: DNA repair protein RecN [Clostridiales bacterium]|nr:DNA repair protein RecN [Clostridiales bacterium]